MRPTLYHNPRCSTSRAALDLLRERGIEPEVVEYLRIGWDEATLRRLGEATGLGVRGLLRAKEPGAAALLKPRVRETTILKAMIADPILVERPILETDQGARVGRPVERVLEVV